MNRTSPSPANASTTPTVHKRDYANLLAHLRPVGGVMQRMQLVVDRLWDEFHTKGVSWVGFYTIDPQNPEQMLLGPRRDKPACSPIGLHGACGRCLTSSRPLVVTDVEHLGAGYIACDPRDRSEVVLPCVIDQGSAWAVLDIDSHDVNAFDVHDALSLSRLLSQMGLTANMTSDAADVVVV